MKFWKKRYAASRAASKADTAIYMRNFAHGSLSRENIARHRARLHIQENGEEERESDRSRDAISRSKMAKSLRKTKYTAAEVLELCTRRQSDESEQEISDVDSEISSDDSVAEEMFAAGEDITLDK